MLFKLPELPFEKDALVPFLSQEALKYHHEKHHKTYVVNLNKLIQGSKLQDRSIEEIIKTQEGTIFNNAAQIFNHTFYWQCMSPKSTGEIVGKIAKKIISTYGSFENFKEQFTKAAINLFGSGWIWLVRKNNKIWIETTYNAGCPLRENKKPLLTLDVWEHAYYIDYRNARPKYIKAWWNSVNWNFVNQNFNKLS